MKRLIAFCVIAVALAGAVALHLVLYRGHSHSVAYTSSRQYDVVVVGAGPGGVAASIQAARMGARVALLEPTDWIGGQMTAAGVGTMDEGSDTIRKKGLYGEFVQRVVSFYGSRDVAVSTCYFSTKSICVDPKIGQAVLKQMLQAESKNLQVFTDTQVTKVVKSGNTVDGVVAGNTLFKSKVAVDADEYGDVLALAGAAYRLGDGTSTALKASSCVQKITYTAVIKKYAAGVPNQLVFRKPVPGYTDSLAAHFSASFSKGFAHFAEFRGLPDLSNGAGIAPRNDGTDLTRTSLNLDIGNDYPASGSLSAKFVTDPKYRVEATCKAKLLTLQLAYYIQHDLGEKDWSIANDEGYDTAYNREHHCASLNGYQSFEYQMPQEAYVREARRLIGEETLTGNELAVSWENPKSIPTYADSVAVGYYPMDVHSCRTANTLEAAFDTAADAPYVYKGGAFEVPMGVLIPKGVDGLLAAEKNISTSRLADGATREQPISMAIGQAVGALAAISAEHNQQPRQVPAYEVQRTLSAESLPTTVALNRN